MTSALAYTDASLHVVALVGTMIGYTLTGH